MVIAIDVQDLLAFDAEDTGQNTFCEACAENDHIVLGGYLVHIRSLRECGRNIQYLMGRLFVFGMGLNVGDVTFRLVGGIPLRSAKTSEDTPSPPHFTLPRSLTRSDLLEKRKSSYIGRPTFTTNNMHARVNEAQLMVSLQELG
jgi:hypothetical protein